ncbi:hypothetical protein V2J09_017088 [Rumex salicifolius]
MSGPVNIIFLLSKKICLASVSVARGSSEVLRIKQMLSEMGRMPMMGGGRNEESFGEELEKEIGLLFRERRRQEVNDRERELNLYRSGSAPPTVEGSMSAVGGLFANDGFLDFGESNNGNGVISEEELRSDPAYLSYYYSHVNLNPRLPPPLLSKEDWRLTQRLQGGGPVLGGIGDRRKEVKTETGGNGRSLFPLPSGFSSKNGESETELEKSLSSAEWGNDGLIGLPGFGLGSNQKSLAEIFQDDLGSSNLNSRHPSRSASRNAFDANADVLSTTEAELANLRQDNAKFQVSSAVHNVCAPPSYSYAGALDASLSRSTTPASQHVPRVPSPCPTSIGGGRNGASEKKTIASQNSFNGTVSGMNESANLVAALSDMKLANNVGVDADYIKPPKVSQDDGGYHMYQQNMQAHKNNILPQSAHRGNVGVTELRKSQFERPKASLKSENAVFKGSYASTFDCDLSPHHGSLDGNKSSFSNYRLGGYSVNSPLSPMMTSQLNHLNLPPLLENVAAGSSMGMGIDSRILGGGLPTGQNLTTHFEPHSLGRTANQILWNDLQGAFVDPMYIQYLRTVDYAAQLTSLNNHSPNGYMDSLQKAYLDSLISHQKSKFGAPLFNKSHPNDEYYGNHAFGVGMGYQGSPLSSPVNPNSPSQRNELNSRYLAALRNSSRGVMKPLSMNEGFVSSLLEEFKSNKTKCFELAAIAGHVVDFSMDQYGSRFIQQKLETATIEEINMVFQDIIPQALALMTDVFGNYVVQKFFEHGMPDQRREFASKLDGHVLTLSLQMYGCRVIQKAIEVVDLDQKIKMVKELDGHIMRCVRDQNGNHVIQKCIECVPEESIQFIIVSFFNQVVTLSTHPYGCRVIQRVLEHCKNPDTQIKVMDEILGSVSMLTQNQYGNYVVQHVLEHGNPHERSTIIKELAGKIVQMSQQKFASNVIEKCLTFGGPDQKELIINELLGTTDENEPLQVMMKDQFGNYVVQKVLETCNDQQRELIMSRIKVHLTALKKYTYGKHIVARVEKLLAVGGRRAGQNPSAQLELQLRLYPPQQAVCINSVTMSLKSF